jgi:hypothetical protein
MLLPSPSREALTGATFLGFAFAGLFFAYPSWGISTCLGLRGVAFGLPGLVISDKRRWVVYAALVVNALLVAYFTRFVLVWEGEGIGVRGIPT